MADDDHSLLLLDFLDTIRYAASVWCWKGCSWMKRSFRSVFDFQSAQHCTENHTVNKQLQLIQKSERLAYHVLYVVNTLMILN